MNHGNNLEHLASARFNNLSDAETKVLRAASDGELAFCGPSQNLDDLTNDPAIADTWGPERHVRAALLRWLCIEAKDHVDPSGVQICGAKIVGELYLAHVTLQFPFAFACCHLAHNIVLEGSRTKSLSLAKTCFRSILADGAVVQGAVFVQQASHCGGQLRFAGAQIEGQFSCCNSFFEHISAAKAVGHASIILDGATVRGAVLLRDGFQANNEVRMLRAHIGADLDCCVGSFRASKDAGGHYVSPALNADGITVGGSVLLRNVHSDGLVTLHGARIDINLDCMHAQIDNAPRQGINGSGEALLGDLAIVHGSVILSGGFHATGVVRFISARVSGDLRCTDATIHDGLVVERATIDGTIYWRDIRMQPTTQLDLMNSVADSLCDDEASWPCAGYLQLHGFNYQRLALSSPRAVQTRLVWLARIKQFSRQPYLQLANVLRSDGDDAGARRVLYMMEDLRSEKDDSGWFARLRNSAFRITVGYGYYPGRALKGLLLLVVVGFFFYFAGYSAGSITPTDKEAYTSFRKSDQLPPSYERFHASLYSLENSFPLIKIGQADRWQPDPNRQHKAFRSCYWVFSILFSPAALDGFRVLQSCLGWFLATMGVGAVTGIIRKE